MAHEFFSTARAEFIIVKRVPASTPGAEGTVRTFASTRGGGDDDAGLGVIEAEIQLLVDGLQELSYRRDEAWKQLAERKSQGSRSSMPDPDHPEAPENDPGRYGY